MTGMQMGLSQGAAPQMTGDLRRAIALLQLGNAALAGHLAAAQNPHLEVVAGAARQEPGLWLDRMRLIPAPPPPQAGQTGPCWAATGGNPVDDLTAAAAPGLVAHVEAQLGLLLRDQADRAIARHFLEALEPSGWLGAPVATVAARAGCSPARAEAVLARLQQVEPAGLFARGLAECLRLQAEDRGLLTPAFAALLANLPLAAEGDADALALACGVPTAEVAALMRRLRGLDPKPGAAFGQGPVPDRAPDLLLRPVPEGWLLELNDTTLPAVTVRPQAEGGGAEALRAARWLDHAFRRRNATVLAIAAEIVARQQGLLARGRDAMDALTIAEVAGATGLHRSTVSRVTAALRVALPGRVLPLRAFFSAPAPATLSGPAPLSTAAARALLARLVAAENPAAPLSDAALAGRLAEAGAAVARRTVAKYRSEAGIPPRDRRGRPR